MTAGRCEAGVVRQHIDDMTMEVGEEASLSVYYSLAYSDLIARAKREPLPHEGAMKDARSNTTGDTFIHFTYSLGRPTA